MDLLQSVALITHSETMRAILQRIDLIAGSDSSVLLIGETGVGKELFAEYIHRISQRAEQPLVKVGLSELPPELLESELFGHDKGAYTGASVEKKGLFEVAEGGTLFLDDIDDFPVALQSKLLRVLESRQLKRVGGTTTIPLDVRLITASKIDLKQLVEKGMFRADLFYRINVVPINIPPLRERREDVPLLVQHFLKRFAPDREIMVADDATRALMEYDWPGNVRELRNISQRLTLFAKGTITKNDLPPEVQSQGSIDLLIKACHRCFVEDQMTYDQVVACLETNLLRQALQQSNGNKSRAAQLLKMSLSTFRDKLKKYRLDGESTGQ